MEVRRGPLRSRAGRRGPARKGGRRSRASNNPHRAGGEERNAEKQRSREEKKQKSRISRRSKEEKQKKSREAKKTEKQKSKQNREAETLKRIKRTKSLKSTQNMPPISRNARRTPQGSAASTAFSTRHVQGAGSFTLTSFVGRGLCSRRRGYHKCHGSHLAKGTSGQVLEMSRSCRQTFGLMPCTYSSCSTFSGQGPHNSTTAQRQRHSDRASHVPSYDSPAEYSRVWYLNR